MNTGIKALDTVITRWGIHGSDVDNDFQQALTISGRDPRVLKMDLPYCIIREIGRHKLPEQLMLHRFSVPHKKARLACFVTDMEGNILEKVYYGHDRRYWQASEKVERWLSHALVSQQLAA